MRHSSKMLLHQSVVRQSARVLGYQLTGGVSSEFAISTSRWTTHQHTRLCSRSFASYKYEENPFRVLGIPQNSSQEVVKETFVSLAMKNHPDRPGGDAKAFIRLRQAFESIVQANEDVANRSQKRNNQDTNTPNYYDNEEDDHWQVWFFKQTGMDLALDMTEETRDEIVEMYNKIGKSQGDFIKMNKGGYWDMARELAEQQERMQGRRSKPAPLRLAAFGGSGTNDNRMRRRRKRR